MRLGDKMVIDDDVPDSRIDYRQDFNHFILRDRRILVAP
jgi:hypothetical protein